MLEDIIKEERRKESEENLSANNGEPIYGSLCCNERERGDENQRREKIQMILENRRKKNNCCKCIYGRCGCKSRPRSYSDVSV